MTKDAQATITVKKRDKSLNSTQKETIIPGNIFGMNKNSQSVSVDRASFTHFMDFEYQGGMMYLQVDDNKKKEPVILDEVQYHPFKSLILHANFRRVNLKEEIEQSVPVEMTGEVDLPDAEVVLAMQEIAVMALPTDIPESIVVDISTITSFDEKIVLKDVKAPEGVTIIMDEETAEDAVVIVREHEEEPEETEEVSVDDVIVEGEEKSEDSGDQAATEEKSE